VTNASGVEERLSEQPIGTSDEDALLAGIAGGLVGHPRQTDGTLCSTSIPPPARWATDSRNLSDSTVPTVAWAAPPPRAARCRLL